MKTIHTMRLALAVAVGLSAFGTAHARKYKCACHVDQKEAVEALPGDKHECVKNEIFKNHDESVSVQQRYLKLKIGKKNVVQNDGDFDFMIRPRKGYCISAVKDVGADKGMMSSVGIGGYCDSDEWITVEDLTMHKKKATEAKDWTATFWVSASPTSKSRKQYYGRAYYYAQGDDGKRYLGAACLED